MIKTEKTNSEHNAWNNATMPASACMDCLFWYRCRGGKLDCLFRAPLTLKNVARA